MMMIKWDRYRENPRHCQGSKARSFERDPVRGLHQGQRSKPRKQAGHMTATHKIMITSNYPLQLWPRPHMTMPCSYFEVSVGDLMEHLEE